MTDITELQGRITAALDRIGQGIAGLEPPAGTAPEGDSYEVSRLTAALEEERTANAQLEERVRAIRDRQENVVAGLEAETARLRDQLAQQEAAATGLARVNAELRANNAAMRAAIEAGLAEPHLVNKSMMAELDALRAAQGADRAELDAVLGELGPMIAAAEAEQPRGDTADA